MIQMEYIEMLENDLEEKKFVNEESIVCEVFGELCTRCIEASWHRGIVELKSFLIQTRRVKIRMKKSNILYKRLHSKW